jgi:hypothetical protein
MPGFSDGVAAASDDPSAAPDSGFRKQLADESVHDEQWSPKPSHPMKNDLP